MLIPPWGSSNRQSHVGDDGSKVQVIFFLTGPVCTWREKVSHSCACAEHPGEGEGVFLQKEVACLCVCTFAGFLPCPDAMKLRRTPAKSSSCRNKRGREPFIILLACVHAGFTSSTFCFTDHHSSILMVNQLNHVTNTCYNLVQPTSFDTASAGSFSAVSLCRSTLSREPAMSDSSDDDDLPDLESVDSSEVSWRVSE